MTYHSFDGHGIDVASKRADDLDKQALAYVMDHPGCQVLDLGSGAGGQSLRMATAGALVTAIDQYDFSPLFAKLRDMHSLTEDQLQFVLGDVRELGTLCTQHQYAITVLQRTLHYLPHGDAQRLLVALRGMTTDRLYVSVTGRYSLVGETYLCGSEAIVDRFCQLTEEGKDMFQIHEPVYLYDQTEFIELLETTGWQVDQCWVSAFGNIKAVCSVKAV